MCSQNPQGGSDKRHGHSASDGGVVIIAVCCSGSVAAADGTTTRCLEWRLEIQCPRQPTPLAPIAQSPGPPRGDRLPEGGAANDASCLSLCFLKTGIHVKHSILALGHSRAAAAQRARPQRKRPRQRNDRRKVRVLEKLVFPERGRVMHT